MVCVSKSVKRREMKLLRKEHGVFWPVFRADISIEFSWVGLCREVCMI